LETALLTGDELPDDLPFNDYFEYFSPDFRLRFPSSNMENLNSKEYLEKMTIKIIENLRNLQGAPSVAMQDVPPDTQFDSEDEDEEDADERPKGKSRRTYEEYSDSEDEISDGRRNYDLMDGMGNKIAADKEQDEEGMDEDDGNDDDKWDRKASSIIWFPLGPGKFWILQWSKSRLESTHFHPISVVGTWRV